MKTEYTILFLCTICAVLIGSCHKAGNDSFVQCQSFDEFCMQEVFTERLSAPHLWVQHGDDTIRIVRTDNTNDTILYINRGNYWYSSIRITYDKLLWNKIKNRLFPPPIVFGYQINQIDIQRYLMKDTIIEVYFYNEEKHNDLSRYPDDISIYNRQSSKTFIFDDNDSVVSTNKIDQYLKYMHEDDRCIAHNVYKYDESLNTFIKQILNAYGDTIMCDFIQLNALGLYHVPTYQFAIDKGMKYVGLYNQKMQTNITCTTIETGK